MRILLTNDDGITSAGIWAAARGLARVGHLTVIGTTDDWSGCGAAIRVPLGTTLRPYPDVPTEVVGEVEAYAVDAAPGAAILIGLTTGLFAPFDLIASGANYGINIGTDLVHSGTLGAAATGFQRGIDAFGISQERGYGRGEEQHWDGVADVAERLARWFAARSGPPVLLNVNLPNVPFERLRGARVVQPARWGHLEQSRITAEPDASGGWALGVWVNPDLAYPDDRATDLGAVLAGEIALTPVTPTGAGTPANRADLAGLVEALTPSSSI